MSRIQVRPVQMPQAAVEFCKVWWRVYRDDPMWVPPLLMERKDFFNPKKNPYFENAKVAFWIAERDGEAVGTIAATVDAQLQAHEPGMGMFGFFEFVDDEHVAKSLWRAAVTWLRENECTAVRGPFNLTPNHEFGLLIDGFDTMPMIANPHNSSYYQRIYEDVIGLPKIRDWYAYWMDYGPVPEQIANISKRFTDRNANFYLRSVNMKDWDNEVTLFLELYNDAWEANWGHVPLTEKEFRFIAAGLKQVMDPDLAFFAYMGDECVGGALTLPDFNQIAKKMNGSLFPFGWYHALFGRSKIDALRVFVLGVKRKYQRLPIGAPLYLKTWEEGAKKKIRGAEASLILEDNYRMRGALEKLGARIYKTYRTYEQPITPEATEERPF